MTTYGHWLADNFLWSWGARSTSKAGSDQSEYRLQGVWRHRVRSSGLERSADVDRFLPIANEQNASLPTTEKGQGSRVVDKTTQGSTEEIAQSLGVDNLVAPRNLNPQGFSFRVGPDICDDDDGLHNSWDMPAPPDLRALQDLHPTSLTSLQLRTSQSSTGISSQMDLPADHHRTRQALGPSLSTSRLLMIQLQTKYHSQIGVEERLKLTPYRHSGLVPRDTTAETQRPVPLSGPCYISYKQKATPICTYIVILSAYFSRRRGCGTTELMIHHFYVHEPPTCLFGLSSRTSSHYSMLRATQAITETSLQMSLLEQYVRDRYKAVSLQSTWPNGTMERPHQ